MRRSSNILVVNLSLSNLLMIVNSIPSFFFMRDGMWSHGYFACTLSQFMAFFTIILSVTTIMGISLERYRVSTIFSSTHDTNMYLYCQVIVTPLAQKLKGWRMFKFLLSIWIVSILIPLPPTIMSRLLEVRRF